RARRFHCGPRPATHSGEADMTLPLAGDIIRAIDTRSLAEDTVGSQEIGTGGVIATTSGTTQLNVPLLGMAEKQLVAGGLYHWDVRLTLQNSVATDEFTL